MITEEIKEIAAKIGQFFLQENNGDYNAACEQITKLRINRLEMENGRLTIEISRPGMLIGKRGERFEKLLAYLGLPLHIEETKESIVDYIYPYEPMEESDWYTESLHALFERELEGELELDDDMDYGDMANQDYGIMPPIKED